MDNDPPQVELGPEAIVKAAIKDFLLKSGGLKERITVPELESMPLCDRRLLNGKRHIYEKIVNGFSLHTGKEISKKERHEKEWSSTSLTYGEIDFKGFAEIFYVIKKKYNSLLPPGGRFYDLGSGLGKGVIAAALVHDFEVCTGIELLESLWKASNEIKTAYEKILKERPFSSVKTEQGEKSKRVAEKENQGSGIIGFNAAQVDWDGRKFGCVPEIKMECGDILKKDWLDGTLILANSTCFEPYLMWQIAKQAKLLPKDTLFVTITKRLPDYTNWEVIENYHSTMSWGQATIYIHQKRTEPVYED